MKTETEMKAACDHLRGIATQYADNSKEGIVLKKAGIALQLVYLRQLGNDLEEMYKGIELALSEEQKAHLRSMRIEGEFARALRFLSFR